MRRIIPIPWEVLESIFIKANFLFDRQIGDHRLYVRKDYARPIVIPKYNEVDQDVILINIRSAEMTQKEYFQYFELYE